MSTDTLSKQDIHPVRNKVILTDEQRLIVERNMPLISSFMKQYRLWIKGLRISYEDMFQELAIELMISVHDYDPTRGTLSTFFYYRAFNRIRQIYRYEHLDSHKCNFINFSLNQPSSEDILEEVSNVIRDPSINIEDSVIHKSIIEEALKLDAPEILQVILGEITQDKAASILGISQPQVCRRAKKVKQKLYYRYGRSRNQ